jgi:hypothetical protein
MRTFQAMRRGYYYHPSGRQQNNTISLIGDPFKFKLELTSQPTIAPAGSPVGDFSLCLKEERLKPSHTTKSDASDGTARVAAPTAAFGAALNVAAFVPTAAAEHTEATRT